MPRSWRSVRAPKDSKDTTTSVNQDLFDFEFISLSRESDLLPASLNSRLNMFNGTAFRSRRSKHEPGPQPPSASRVAVDKRLQLTKVEESWIGVAFGSPTHPPTSIPAFSSTEVTTPYKHAFRNEGPLPATPSGRSRKFGNLFKSKPGPMMISAPTSAYRIDGEQILGMPIARRSLLSPNDLPEWVNAEDPEAFTPVPASVDPRLDERNAVSVSNPRRTSLPRLEIQIPNIEMDRYSVMFSGVSGIKPSNLLERRSKNLSKMNHIGEDAPPMPPLKSLQPRRSTTPNHHRRTSSTYSLFPAQPRSRGRDTEFPENPSSSRQSSVTRPHTSDGVVPQSEILLPSVDQRCATPERTLPESMALSPDDTVASSERDDSPWRSSGSMNSVPSSRTSIGSEIFFDVKPASDSNGTEHSQYIIHKPDSAIELALSRSRRSRKSRDKRQEEETVLGSPISKLHHEDIATIAEQKWRLSLELNEAIREVEKLTSPFTSLQSRLNVSEMTGPHPPPTTKEIPASIRLRKKYDGLAIGIPSPITERSEEFSPRATPPVIPVKLQPRTHIAALSIQPAPLTMYVDSPTVPEEFIITPPPVPIKDAKFLPISKFAAAGSAVKLVHHHPKRPTSKLTATDNQVLRRKPVSTPKRPTDIVETECQSHLRKQLHTAYSTKVPSASALVDAGIVAVAVQPAAEVSVARRVSLSRKQRQKIQVSSPKHRAVESMNDLTLSPIAAGGPTTYEATRGHKPCASYNVVVKSVLA